MRIRGFVLSLALAFPLALRPSGLQALTITEIHYAPPAGDSSQRFVELFNDASSAVDLSGWVFVDGIQFTIPEGTVLAGRAYLVVAARAAALQARYPIANVVGDFTGSLSLDGETIEIVNRSGAREVLVSYRDRGKWPSAPRSTGHTLSLRDPFLDPDDGVNWSASLDKGGTPGRANFPSATPGFIETDLVAPGEVWRYRKGTAEFSNPLAAWRAGGFDDTSWLTGQTGIGYGDLDDATQIDDMENAYLAIACRKTFQVTAPALAGAEEVVLGLDYDDGFIAYLNGVEVARAGLGAPGEATPFDATAESHEAAVEEQFSIPKNRLAAGANVLAVQVHNTALDSTDLSFLPRLALRTRIPAGTPGASAVVFNELFARTPGERWLELLNRGAAAANLEDHCLTDDPAAPLKFVFPPGTSIPPGGFLVVREAQAGFSFAEPEVALYLSTPGAERFLEARVFENATATDRAGTSDIRFPDGAPDWAFARSPTRGAANRLEVERDLVINEIMYHPLETRMAANQGFEARPGEFIEIHNRGSRVISLAGFRFTAGADFAFPAGAEIAPGGYAVVAQDPAWLTLNYALAGVHGPWQGSLQNDGETIRLEDALGNTVDEVRYADGGDWSELADGGGSSLELADPRDDNSAGGAWEASDESRKAPWALLSYAGDYRDLGEDLFRFTPATGGSFLLDDVEIVRGGTQYVGESGFENGTSSWLMEGALVHSRRITSESHSGAACLQVIATDRGDLRVNRLAVIPRLAMAAGTYTVRFWARWLEGGNLILAHGHDNDLARALWLPVPRDLGTPGRENGATARLRAAGGVNAGPALRDPTQSPPRPRPGEDVTVSVRATDPDGVASVKVFFRLNRRDGPFTGLDLALAPDAPAAGRYAGTLPGQPEGTKVLYYFEATDTWGRPRRYPAAVPERTLLYQHGNPEGGPLIHYRLVLDDDRQDELENRPLQSDDPLFGSFIFNDAEVYHSVGVHYHGSAWERPGNPRSFKVRLPGDHRLQGTKSFNVSRYGASANDASAHYLIGRNGLPGEPAPHCRYQFIRWDVGGEDQGIMGRVERVDGAYLKRWFRGDDEGPLLRANAKITFRVDEGWDLARWAAIEDWGADKEDYRWNWDLHTRELDDDWTQFLALFRIFDPGSTQSDAEFEARLAEKFDVDEFVRVVAVRALNTDWDSLGFGNGQNTYLYYAPIQGRWAFLPWDMDGTFGDAGFPFEPTADPGINRLLSRPNFYRKYLQAMRRSLFDGWQEETLHRFLAPSTAAGVGNEDGILGLLNARRPAALSFADRGGPFRVTTNGGRDFSVAAESVTLTGEAPIAARFILLDGVAFQPTWTGPTAWRAIVFLAPGPNPLEFLTFDDGGSLLGNATITVTSTITWQPPSLASLTPASGPEGGGTQVAIAGTDFHAGAAVRFGAADGVVASVTPTRIVVTAPPGAGAVDVRVTNRDGQSALRAGAFTYTRPRFIRGDASGDALVNIADSLAALDYLFAGGLLDCLSAADANDDGAVDISDPLRVLFFLFAAGAPLPPPGPTAGVDPTADALSCSRG